MSAEQILVVEDESVVAAYIEQNLKQLGYRVPGIAETGAEAIDMATEVEPDLVLMDITLKGSMDGVVAAQAIRTRANVPVVYLTAHADEATLRRAKVTEPYGYLVKPFNDRDLRSTIEMALYKHQMDRQVRDSERRLAATLRAIGDAVIVTDTEARTTFLNPMAETLTGWASSEAIGRDVAEILTMIDERTGAPIDDPAQAALRTGVARGSPDTALLLTRDGRRIPIADTTSFVHTDDASIAGVVLALRDVTRIRQATEAIRRSEEQFRMLVENSADIIFVIDRRGLVRFGSRAIERLLGYAEGELIGTAGIDLVHADDAPRIRYAFRRMLTWKDRHPPMEYRIRHKGGAWRTFESIARDLTGRLSGGGVVVNCRDVTERKDLESRLVSKGHLATIGMLTTGVVHEINNPMTYVLANLDDLVAELPDLLGEMKRYRELIADWLGEEQARAILKSTWTRYDENALEALLSRATEAANGARRVIRVAQDLRAFSGVRADEPTPARFDLAMDAALRMAQSQIHHRIRITKEYEPVPFVMASPGGLSQVFLNLLINAIHAFPERRMESDEIRLRTWAANGYVFGEVGDTGMGISKEDRGLIFDPFFKSTLSGVGTGLGLSTSRNIVESYGGTLEVEGAPGRGSRFIVRLPACAESATNAGDLSRSTAANANADATPPAVLPIRRARILIVDDEPLVAATMKRMIGRPHNVVVAHSVQEARRLLDQDDRFAVIFCDLIMPGGSGVDLHRWLSEARPELATRIVFVTGGVFAEDVLEFLKRTQSIVIEKPFEERELRAAIARVRGMPDS